MSWPSVLESGAKGTSGRGLWYDFAERQARTDMLAHERTRGIRRNDEAGSAARQDQVPQGVSSGEFSSPASGGALRPQRHRLRRARQLQRRQGNAAGLSFGAGVALPAVPGSLTAPDAARGTPGPVGADSGADFRDCPRGHGAPSRLGCRAPLAAGDPAGASARPRRTSAQLQRPRSRPRMHGSDPAPQPGARASQVWIRRVDPGPSRAS